MRIDELHVEGFGILSNLSLTDIPPGLAVILGNNEAGKTTLLAFLRSVLFGLPTRLQKDFYPPVNGVRKGGRIVVSNEHANGIIVERYEGKGNGLLTVTFPDGSQGGEEELSQLIGSATDELYRNVFAFSLAELREFDTLQTEKVRDAMYSACLGAGRRTLPEVMQLLQKQSGELFAPRASNPRMNKLLNRIDRVKSDLREHATDQDAYDRVHTELQDCDARIQQLASELTGARRRQSHVQLLHTAWNQWTELNIARGQLDSLPLIETFPEDALQRLEILQTEKKGLEDRLQKMLSDRNTDQQKRNNLDLDRDLLAVAAEVQELERGQDLNAKNGNDLLSLQSDCELQQKQLLKSVGELGDEWDEEKLIRFDLSISSREQFERCRQNLMEQKQAERDLQAKHVLQTRQLDQASAHQEEARESRAKLPQPNGNLKVDAIKAVQAGLESYVSARQDLPTVAAQSKTRIENLQDTLRRIGPNWDEQKLESFDTSLAVQDQVSIHQTKLADLQSAQAMTVERLRDLEARNRESSLKLERSAQALAALPTPETEDEALLADRVRNIKQLRTALSDNEKRVTEANHLEERQHDLASEASRLAGFSANSAPAQPRWLVPVLILIGLLGGPGLILYTGSWIEGVALFVTMLAIAAILYFRKPGDTADKTPTDSAINNLNRSAEDLKKRKESLRAAIRQADLRITDQAQSLKLAEQPAQQAIDELESQINQQISLLRDRTPLAQKLADDKQALVDLQQQVRNTSEQVAQQDQDLSKAQQEWQAWLVEAGLPDTQSPARANNTLARLDAAREQLKQIKGFRQRIAMIKSAMDTFETLVKDATTDSGVKDLPADEEKATARLADCLEEFDQQTRRRQDQDRRLEEANQQTTREKEKVEESALELSRAEQSRARSEEQWADLLHKLQLPMSLAAEMAGTVLQTIERARDKYDHVATLRKQEVNLQKLITDYRETANLLLTRIGRSIPAAADLAVIVSGLVSEVERTEEVKRKLESLNEIIANADIQITQEREAIQNREQLIQQLFETAATDNEESFRHNAANYATRQDIQGTIQNIQIQLKHQAGGSDELTVMEQELQQTTLEDLGLELQKFDRSINELEESQRTAADEGGRLKEQMERLERSEEVSRLRSEQQSDLSLLLSDAEEWSILKTTAYLIDRAREKYEKERRPGVLREAETYFSRFTNGAYTGVQAPLGNEEILVRAEDGTTRNVDQLSTGTAEQLYLSLRFGFVKEFVRRSESLPLIFDDILVNFDPGRARAASEAIVELAGSLQILFFTCQPGTVEVLKDVDGSIPVFDLRSGELKLR